MQLKRGELARDIMSSPVTTVGTESTLADAARLLSESHISGALVTDDQGLPMGVVSLFDIVTYLAGFDRLEGEPGGFYHQSYPRFDREEDEEGASEAPGEPSPLNATVGDIMATEIIAVAPDAPLSDVVRTLWKRRIHRVFVRDGPGAVMGIISTMDVLGALGGAHRAKATW